MFELNDNNQAVFFSAELAKQTLFMAAFPLLTTLYGYRGLKGPITPSKPESKVAKYLKVSPETLNEWYSVLIPFGYYITKKACNVFGVVSMFWATHVGFYDDSEFGQADIHTFMETTGVVADAMSWISGLVGLGALGIWTYRRQQRRTKDMWTVGVPEVALAAFIPLFYISTAVPSNEHMMEAFKTYYRVPE